MSQPSSIRILLVEDSGTMRKMEAKILAGLGYEDVIESVDGQAAIAYLEGPEQVDLVISDWNMPNKDGMELLKWIRAHATRGQTPFIMATAQAERSREAAILEAGGNGVVAKPFDGEELKKVINSALSGEAGKSGPACVVRQPQVSPQGKLQLRLAHIQITDHLVLGVLKHHLDKGLWKADTFDLDTVRMPGWNPVQQALLDGETDGALVLAPIAMDLYAYGCPIKLVLFAHKNGSIFVRSAKKAFAEQKAADFYRDTTFYIPHRLSVHHMLAHQYLSSIGLSPGVPGEGEIDVRFEVVPPIKMPEFLATSDSASGFMVAEPLGTNSIAAGIAQLQFLSGQVWPNHPCCVVTLRQEIIDSHPQAVQEFVELMVQAGQFIAQNPGKAAEIAVGFLDPEGKLGLSHSVLKNVLTEPDGITTHDLLPVLEDLKKMQSYMHQQMGVGGAADLDQFVELGFAQRACRGLTAVPAARAAAEAATPGHKSVAAGASKHLLSREGKYLSYMLGDEEFGINILKVKEIIGMMPVTPLPQTPEYIKGVINLRGKVIPVVDLRLKFGLPEAEYNERTCIIVVEVSQNGSQSLMGVVVDTVSEVLDIKVEQIEEAPDFGSAMADTSYIIGMAKVGDRVRILVDIDVILGQDQVAAPALAAAF